LRCKRLVFVARHSPNSVSFDYWKAYQWAEFTYDWKTEKGGNWGVLWGPNKQRQASFLFSMGMVSAALI